ncbi:RNA polymerase sigma-70 factor, ECF subfamily [Ardenticatena maritima]|uniref:RNA polymerase sigma-70 factor, ECF subfamily n=1 Tax=Ardenticatena maritima TaxID=872965 RepID=A0A0M9UDU1_9CHLR|nr:sigma-70 family RNA polymerase sigma factor [Ardenticatena maritima]GAP64404.1 RNA polymerase sigma-70 factor, ECF subfamily [Ardenticatena maritima]
MTDHEAGLNEEQLVALLQRAQKEGDPEAFGELYRRYANRIYRYLLSKTGNVALAEDLTSQVFVRLIERIGQYTIAPRDNIAIFSAWLYRIAHHLMIDEIRKQQRQANINANDLQHLDTPQPSIAAEVERKLENEHLLKRLNALSEEQRQVILLRFIEQYSIAETARIMGKTEGAVKVLQYRAIKNLRTLLGGNAS